METITKLVLFALKAYSIIFTLSAFWLWKDMVDTQGRMKLSVKDIAMLILAYLLGIYSWFV